MVRKIIVTADDYGLSRGITDSILETVDNGPVRRVSILANGEAVGYAFKEYEKRKDHLELAVHLNLTEGKPLSVPSDIPHLVSKGDFFRHSVGSLWLSYLIASPDTRAAYRGEIRRESSLQINRIRHMAGADTIAINGHQHVHLLPFVADELTAMPQVSSLRLVCEPLFFAGRFSLEHWFIRPVIYYLSRRHAVVAHAGNEWFVGFLYAGRMTIEKALEGLKHIPSGGVEILFHPGSALPGEFDAWSGDLEWHYSSARQKELQSLMNKDAEVLLAVPNFEINIYKQNLRTPFRFIISGSLSMIVTLVLLYVLTEWAGLWYVFSATMAFTVSIMVSFVLQKFWTFGGKATVFVRSQFVAFVFLNLINVVLNVLGLYLVVEKLHVWYVIAEIFVAGVIAIWSFFVMRTVIFKS